MHADVTMMLMLESVSKFAYRLVMFPQFYFSANVLNQSSVVATTSALPVDGTVTMTMTVEMGQMKRDAVRIFVLHSLFSNLLLSWIIII